MEKPLKITLVLLKVGWGGVSGNHRGRENSFTQIDGDSAMVPICQLCDGRGQQRKNGLCQTSCFEESCFSSSPPISDNWVTSHVFLVLFQLLPQCWSSSKFVQRHFKRSAWDSRSPLSHTATISTVFHSQKLWGLLFLARNPGLGVWCGVVTPCSSGRTSAAEISLPIFICHT